MIDISQVSLKAGEKNILSNIDLNVRDGEIIGLIGPNGAGKTSLLKILANIQADYTGSYQFQNKDIATYSSRELAKSFGYLPQDATAHWPLTCHRLIELGRIPHQGFRQKLNDKDLHAIKSACDKAEVNHLLDRVATTLSGGERTRVFLARLFASEPKVIFADEPIAALDPYHQLHIMEILNQHARSGGTVIVVLHDISLASRFCDRLVLMKEGRIAGQGEISDLLKNDLLQKTYGVDLKLFCDKDSYTITPWSRYEDIPHP